MFLGRPYIYTLSHIFFVLFFRVSRCCSLVSLILTLLTYFLYFYFFRSYGLVICLETSGNPFPITCSFFIFSISRPFYTRYIFLITPNHYCVVGGTQCWIVLLLWLLPLLTILLPYTNLNTKRIFFFTLVAKR